MIDRISREAGMASLFIKDQETAEAVARVARRMGTSKTNLVREAVRRIEAELDAGDAASSAPHRLKAREIVEQFWREHPLPPPTGLKADKAFFDELSGDS